MVLAELSVRSKLSKAVCNGNVYKTWILTLSLLHFFVQNYLFSLFLVLLLSFDLSFLETVELEDRRYLSKCVCTVEARERLLLGRAECFHFPAVLCAAMKKRAVLSIFA